MFDTDRRTDGDGGLSFGPREIIRVFKGEMDFSDVRQPTMSTGIMFGKTFLRSSRSLQVAKIQVKASVPE